MGPCDRAPRTAGSANPAGGRAAAHARRLARESALLGTVGALAAATAIVPPPHAALPLGLVTVAVWAMRARRLRQARRWLRGAAGERAVGRDLNPLRRQGWLVVHDVVKPTGGNVDHIVAHARAGVFTIETKRSRFGGPELAQARSHAEWASRLLGVRVRPLLCVAGGRGAPRVYADVWCMGSTRLPAFLRAARGHADEVDVARVRAALDAVTPAPTGRARARRPGGPLRRAARARRR